jgi:hypothetical protein
MKKLLIGLGGLFVVLLVIGGVGIAYVAIKGSALDGEAKTYADAAIPAIVGGWNESELETRLSPEFRSVTSTADLDKLFNAFRRLGGLKSYNGAKGQAIMSATTQNGSQTIADYIGSADFDAGPAQIELKLIKHGEQWQILGFRVNSRTFLEQR